ncbi:MAG: HAD family phosphatase [Deltaproteobacteria bacterium]|nr:HAD family phosphatase [Deltaproteobacteria bacterium]
MSPNTPKAFLCDFDGVLVDLEPLHCKAWQETLKPLGPSFSSEEYDQKYLGLNDRDIAKKVFVGKKRLLSPHFSQELLRQKEMHSKELFLKGVPVIEGAPAFLEKTFVMSPIALVTGALPGEVYFVLDQLKWRHYFSFIITAADVERGKPDPEGYLKAFEKIKTMKKWDPPLKKSDCLILEDSQYGIEAAKKAEIPCKVVKGSLLIGFGQ